MGQASNILGRPGSVLAHLEFSRNLLAPPVLAKPPQSLHRVRARVRVRVTEGELESASESEEHLSASKCEQRRVCFKTKHTLAKVCTHRVCIQR